MSTDTSTSVRASTTVDLPIDQAFTLFTEGIGTWWNPDHHIIESPYSHMVFEPFVGGNIIDRGVDGSECDWGRVLAWEPPHRVLFTWQIDGTFRFDPDPDHASEIEARFRAEGPEQTVVEVEHRHLDRLVGGETVRATIEGGGGWALLLESYGAAAKETER